MKKIGFIGLGIMGKPMAKNLMMAGYPLTVYDLRPEPVQELVAAGAVAGRSPKEVAARSEVTITMLPDSPNVEDAVLGADGLIEGVRPGTFFIDMSSIAPRASREISSRLAEKGVAMLDAPVSGGEPKAVDGTLAIMVGGPQAVFDEVRDILGVMGKSITHVGEIGSGNVTKLANQIIVAVNIAAASEALVLAAKAGVNPETVFNAIRGGLAGSTVLEAKVPMMLARNFRPGFRIELHIKDLMNALHTADDVKMPIPLARQALEIMEDLRTDGKAGNDHSGMVQHYEKIAGIKLRK